MRGQRAEPTKFFESQIFVAGTHLDGWGPAIVNGLHCGLVPVLRGVGDF